MAGRSKPVEAQPGLFDAPPHAPVRPSPTMGGAGARWSAYKAAGRVQCDDCVTSLHAAGGVGSAVRSARWKRTTADQTLLLCSAHMEIRRAEEGLAPLRALKGR